MPGIPIWANDSVADPNIKVYGLSICSRNDIAQYEEKAIAHKQNYILYYSSTKTATEVKEHLAGIELVYSNPTSFNMYEFLNQYQDFLSDSYGIVDLGSLNDWAIGSQGDNWYSQSLLNIIAKPAARNVKADCYCSAYQIVARDVQDNPNPVDLSFSVAPTGNITVIDLAKVNYTPKQFQAAMQGIYVVFKLADNIGRINLGNIAVSSWLRTSWGANYVFQTTISNMTTEIANKDKIYCSKYQTIAEDVMYANEVNKAVANNPAAADNLKIVDNDYDNTTDFANALKNIYFYYYKR